MPAALLGALVVGAALQLLWTGEPDLPPVSFVGRIGSAPGVAESAVPPVTAPAVIQERALFAPTRSASSGPARAGGSGPLGGATVVGSVRRGRAAWLFLKLPDGTIRTLAPGASFMDWRLSGIGGDAALFTRGGERLRIPFGRQAPVSASDGDEEKSEE